MQKTLEKTAAQLKAEEKQKIREQNEDRKVDDALFEGGHIFTDCRDERMN